MKVKMRPMSVAVAVVALLSVMAVINGCTQTTTPTTVTPPAKTATTATTAATPTVAGIALGKQIFDTGNDNVGALRFTGGIASVKTAACMECHGANGKGNKQLGGPDIRGSKLKPDFNEVTFSRAVTRGLDEKGDPLESKMPHIDASAQDINALWLYVNSLP